VRPGTVLAHAPASVASCAPKNPEVRHEGAGCEIHQGLFAGGRRSGRVSAWAADYPVPKEADWVGAGLPLSHGRNAAEVRLHYTTLGAPSGEPVLVLHGTADPAPPCSRRNFAGELFGPGQPLDASRYFVILPDALGTGKSTRPSDGLRARFPKYNYEDMVLAQYRLVTEGLSIKHLRLVLGNSMGACRPGSGREIPESMDALVPMACQPTEMSGRNWMLRRLLVESIRSDPDWNGGSYTSQPKSMQRILVQFGIATSADRRRSTSRRTRARRRCARTRSASRNPSAANANDVLYQWESSDDYNPSPGLERIRAALVAINAATTNANPPELGISKREIKRVKGGRYVLIPASGETRAMGLPAMPRYEATSRDLLQRAPRMGKVAAAQSTTTAGVPRGRGSVPSRQRVRCG